MTSTDLHWGTLSDDDGNIHVLPCDGAGFLMPPHSASIACACHPTEEEPKIIVHGVIQ